MGKGGGKSCSRGQISMDLGLAAGAGAAVLPAANSAPLRLLEVSHASTEDIPRLAEIKREVARRAYEPHHAGPQLEQWLAEHCGEDHYRYRVGRSGYSVLVARDAHGEIVGVATMRKRGNRADMSGLYVTRPGEGIGSRLVAAREQLARELGCDQVRASVWRTNQQGARFVTGRGLVKAGGYRETTVGVMVDHYEGPLGAASPAADAVAREVAAGCDPCYLCGQPMLPSHYKSRYADNGDDNPVHAHCVDETGYAVQNPQPPVLEDRFADDPVACAVRASLSEDLLQARYRNGERPYTGHCYVASEAYYHLMGGKAAGWTPVTIQHEGGPHRYLRHADGRIIDLTHEQFATPVAHAQGRGCGFMGKPGQPSKRAQIVLDRARRLLADGLA